MIKLYQNIQIKGVHVNEDITHLNEVSNNLAVDNLD